MNIEESRKIAMNFLNDESQVIKTVKKTNECFLFFFDYPESEDPTPSAPIVSVNRNTGIAKHIIIPSKEGFELLNEAEEI